MRGQALLVKMMVCKEEAVTKRRNSPMMPALGLDPLKMTFLKMQRCYCRVPLTVTMSACLLMGRLGVAKRTRSKGVTTT